MTFQESVKTCFSKYATFSGRATRSEYWYFAAFNAIVGAVLGVIGFASDMTFLSNIYSVAVFLPGLAVAVRRLHDIGKSGWSYLWVCLPIIGWIMLLIWVCKASTPEENEYGPAEA